MDRDIELPGREPALAPTDLQSLLLEVYRRRTARQPPSAVLALECALRRRKLLRADSRSHEAVHLAASHRLLRGQRYEGPGLLSHFCASVLCSAGRDVAGAPFELLALGQHIRFYLRALRAFLGSEVPLHVSATDLNGDGHRELLRRRF